MRLLFRGITIWALAYAQVFLIAKNTSAELLLGTDDTLVSCSTFFSTPYHEQEGAIVHVQYLLDENPYLCNTNFDSFLSPWHDASGESTSTTLLGLVALSGNCSLKEKAQMMESLSKDHISALKFLIVIDEDSAARRSGLFGKNDSSSGSRPVNSERHMNSTTDDGWSSTQPFSTSVTVLSVNQKCGNHLLRYMENQKNYTRSQGGPPVLLLSDDDRGASNSNSWQGLLQLVALIIFSFAGSFLMAHIAFSFCRPARHRRRRRRRGGDASNQEGQARLCLLSEAHVERFQTEEATHQFFALYYSSSKAKISPDSADGSSSCGNDDDPDSNSIHIPTCAVCLEAIALPCKVAVLPCGHPFHAECITPWLTQRQACCPLCKLVLLDPTTLEESAISAVDSQRTLDEEAGGVLGGASVGDENSIVTSDVPDSGLVVATPVPFQRRRHWWNRWRRSSSAAPASPEAALHTDLALTATSEPITTADQDSTSTSESSPSILTAESQEL